MIEKPYSEFSDEELIARYRDGESQIADFLLEKYKNLVRKRANALFLLGGDTDDLIQEGMIGLFKAIRDYGSGQSSFFNFADLCISRQLYSAIEAAGRKKHVPLNSYVSLSADGGNEVDAAFGDAIQNLKFSNPEQMVIERENLDHILNRIRSELSPLERKVFQYHLEGYHYRKIAEIMKKSDKTIDNALQRIRNKAQKILIN